MVTKKKNDGPKKKDINIIKLRKGETVSMTKALGSNKRLQILRVLTDQELNLSEIAEKLDISPQAAYHHLQILEKSKLVSVVREVNIKNMAKTIKYYRANYHPDAINILLWAPLDVIEPSELSKKVPIPTTPVQRIVRKMAPDVFKEVNDYKIEILTAVVKDMIDLTHESLNNLKKEYGLEMNEKIWNLILFFAELSVMNAVKNIAQNEEYKKHATDLFALICEEFVEEEFEKEVD